MIFVYLFTFLRNCVSIWKSPVLLFITINDKLVTPYLSFEVKLNMASIASMYPWHPLRFAVWIWCDLRNLAASGIKQVTIGHCQIRNGGLTGQPWKMTSHSIFNIRFSETSLDVFRGFLFKFGVIWEVCLPWVFIENWPSLKKECHIDRVTAEKWLRNSKRGVWTYVQLVMF